MWRRRLSHAQLATLLVGPLLLVAPLAGASPGESAPGEAAAHADLDPAVEAAIAADPAPPPETAGEAAEAAPLPQRGDLGEAGALAAAAEPVPPPGLPATVDPYARYEAENTCSPTAKPGTLALQKLLFDTWTTDVAGITRACTGASGHGEGRALDWMTNVRNTTQRAEAEAFLSWLLATDAAGNAHAMARRTGVMYLIWNNRMWRAYDPYRGGPSGWVEYGTCFSRTSTADDTYCHRDHVHVSMSWDGAMARTSYWAAASGASCWAPSTAGTAPAIPTTPLNYVPLTPVRLLDTRTGTGVGAPCPLPAGGRVDLQVTGRGGVPSTGVAAVVLNVAGVPGPPTTSTHVSVYPTNGAGAGTSSLNLLAGQTRAALVTAAVGAGGKVTLRNNAGQVHLVADVVGYHPTGTAGSKLTVAAAPVRLLDTRTTAGPLAERAWRTVQVSGRAGVPAGATAVLLNVTAVGGTPGAYLALAPTAGGTPSTSSLNQPTSRAVANRAYARLAPDGTLAVWSSKPTQLVLDVVGYVGAASAQGFVPVTPTRLADTRTGTGVTGSLQGPRSTVTVPVTGRAGVPAGARAAVVTLTGTAATTETHLSAWGGGSWPATSDLNLAPREAVPNLAVVPLATDGSLRVGNHAGASHLVVDVVGYIR